MVWPILISVSLVPGPYCFCASAGDISRVSKAALKTIPRREIPQRDIRLPPKFFIYGRSVGERPRLGKQSQAVRRASIMLRCRCRHCQGLSQPLAGFLCRCGDLVSLAPLTPLGATCLCACGLMFIGAPASATGSGPARKKTRQPGESSALRAIMQAVTRSTSGISELQSRNASPVQACCCSGVYARPAVGKNEDESTVASVKPGARPLDRTALMNSPEAVEA